MQSLSRDILSNIFNVLPWKEAWRLESLSSQFHDLEYETTNLMDELKIADVELDFRFGEFIIQNGMMRVHLHNYRSQLEVKPEKRVEFAAHFYRKLVRRFRFNNILFLRLPEEFYRKISPVNPEIFRKVVFTFQSIEKRPNEAEWAFLRSINCVRFFSFKGYLFEEDLWNLPCVQTGKQIEFYFKSNFPNQVVLGLNDTFLQKLIDRKMIILETNGSCSVTFDFLFDYIQKCLFGLTHIMHYLELHIPNRPSKRILEAKLNAMGFRQIPKEDFLWEKEVENRPPKDGYDPDKIFIQVFYGYWFKMVADFAQFRRRRCLSPALHYRIQKERASEQKRSL